MSLYLVVEITDDIEDEQEMLRQLSDAGTGQLRSCAYAFDVKIHQVATRYPS